MFRRYFNNTRVEILRLKVQRAREACRTTHEHETKIIAAF